MTTLTNNLISFSWSIPHPDLVEQLKSQTYSFSIRNLAHFQRNLRDMNFEPETRNRFLVPKEPRPGKDHGNSMFISRLYGFLVSY
jgi:hypothetical protein